VNNNAGPGAPLLGLRTRLPRANPQLARSLDDFEPAQEILSEKRYVAEAWSDRDRDVGNFEACSPDCLAPDEMSFRATVRRFEKSRDAFRHPGL